MSLSTHVLCVDDEPINLLILKKLLGKKYTVITADSGKQGLELLEQNPSIYFIISDMRMPEMDGLEFIRNARESFPDKKYFMLSGFALNEPMQEALDAGLILRYFTKPAKIAEIQAALDKHKP